MSRSANPFVDVLLVEQDSTTISDISTLLSAIPECRLRISTSFEDALLTILENTPQIILFAHGLPGRNSLEVLGSIRNKYPSIYLIVILPTGNQDLMEEYKKGGAADCIIKDENYTANLDDAVKKAFIRILSGSVSEKTPFLSADQSQASDEILSMLSALQPGEQILHYRIIDAIGEGGMGEVYKAEDLKLKRTVAIKSLPLAISNNDQARRRFLREAQLASKLNHPGIVTIHTIEEVDDFQFIVMEYVEGQSLKAILDRGPLPWDRLIQIGSQIAEALAAAHGAGLIHRDIKPANIMISSQDKVKILDFGLAKPVSVSELSGANSSLTKAGVILGTVHYMSPEQSRGETLDARSDIFSLGCVLYQAATGKMPFAGANILAIMHAIATSDPPPPSSIQSGLHKEFDNLIARCLAKDKAVRKASAQELMADLQKLLLHTSMVRTSFEQDSAMRNRLTSNQTDATRDVQNPIVARPKSGKRNIDSLAVLPFVSMSPDPDLEYLSDGITESLINSLSQLPKLRVVSRATVYRYKGKAGDPSKIATELNVQKVLAGRVLQRENNLSIRVELVDATKDAQIWGEQYNKKLSDIFELQEEIASQIASQLKLKLTREEKKKLAKRETQNQVAYDLYLKGRYFWNKRTRENMDKGFQMFQQSLALDSRYSLAYGGIADYYVSLVADGELAPRFGITKAKEALMKAVELDNSRAEFHTSLAYIHLLYDWNWEASEKEFLLAMQLNPGYVEAHHQYSHLLLALKRFDESLSESKRALELEPFNIMLLSHLGLHYYCARQYDLAIQTLKSAIEIEAGNAYTHFFLGRCYEQQQLLDQAIVELEKSVAHSRVPQNVGGLGLVYARRSPYACVP